jgi:hypothetical protein
MAHFQAQQNRIKALEAALGIEGTTIHVVGGLPPGAMVPAESKSEPAPESRNNGVSI